MKLLKTLLLASLLTLFGLSLIACHKQPEAANVVKVGIIDGPSTPMWEQAQKTALNKFGLDLELVKFSDYVLPNQALNDGDIDANAFQHVPFLDAQLKARGFKLIPIAKTFVYPVAMYSNKIKKLSALVKGDTIAIPNDPSNEARALLLLQQAKLITLRKGAGVNATPADIISNPKQLNFKELDAAQLPRVLSDVTAAVINNDYAGPAGLNAKTALVVENSHSPYMNVIVIRPSEQGSKKIKELIESFQTAEVKAIAKRVSHNNAVAGW
jgi:D-methionine transport system substrate-binding protein